MTNRNDENALKVLSDFIEANTNFAQARQDLGQYLPTPNACGIFTHSSLPFDKDKAEEAKDRMVYWSNKVDAHYKILAAWARGEDIIEAKLKMGGEE